MTTTAFDLPGVWFQFYKEVVELNLQLGEDRLNKTELREVTTTIFIAASHKGVVRPWTTSKFQTEILKLLEPVYRRGEKEAIYSAVRDILNRTGKDQHEPAA